MLISRLGCLPPFHFLGFPGKTQVNGIEAVGTNCFIRSLADFHCDPISQPEEAARGGISLGFFDGSADAVGRANIGRVDEGDKFHRGVEGCVWNSGSSNNLLCKNHSKPQKGPITGEAILPSVSFFWHSAFSPNGKMQLEWQPARALSGAKAWNVFC